MNLNFMTLGGLAISVGRVVDDSIVVLENVYRHIQRGQNRMQVVLEATVEVGPAIIASTLTTIVVFVPLVFLQGLWGAFFLPFALDGLLRAGRIAPGGTDGGAGARAALVRPGDIAESEEGPGDGRAADLDAAGIHPGPVWALRHKAVTLVAAAVVTIGQPGPHGVHPITLFPPAARGSLPSKPSCRPAPLSSRPFEQVGRIESVIQRLSDEGSVEVYQTTVGSPENSVRTPWRA